MISDDRFKHIIGVARRCYELASAQGMPETDCEQMFVLGFLHDIGYEFSDNVGHAEKGADLMTAVSYPYSEDIRKHGIPIDINQQSEALRILNRADIEISAKGERISAECRLKDVAERYGSCSAQYKNMLYLCQQLGLIKQSSARRLAAEATLGENT